MHARLHPSNERSLVDSLVSGPIEQLFGPGFRISREVQVGRSVADIVAFSAKPQASGVSSLSLTESIIVSHLRIRKSTRIDILEQLCGENLRELQKGALANLQSRRLIRSYRGGGVGLARDYAAGARVIALEVKLIKWTRALAQAMSYRKFADECYVVLPKRTSQLALRKAAAFLDSGVGLLEYDGVGLTEIIKPSNVRGFGWQRDYVLSRLVSR